MCNHTHCCVASSAISLYRLLVIYTLMCLLDRYWLPFKKKTCAKWHGMSPWPCHYVMITPSLTSNVSWSSTIINTHWYIELTWGRVRLSVDDVVTQWCFVFAFASTPESDPYAVASCSAPAVIVIIITLYDVFKILWNIIQ